MRLIWLLVSIGHMYFDWYMVWRGSKNRYQKDTPLKKIGLHAQNLINHSRLNTHHNWGEGGDLYDYLLRTRIFTMVMKQDIHRSSRIMTKVATTSIRIC